MQSPSNQRMLPAPSALERGSVREPGYAAGLLPVPLLVHELRAPLQSITTAFDTLQLLLERAGAPADSAAGTGHPLEIVEAGQRAAQHLAELLRRLRRQPELTLTDDNVDSQPFDLLDGIESVFEIVAPFAQAHGIETRFAITSPVEIRVIGDHLRFEQALLNLVRNGMRRVLAGGDADKQVTIRLGRSDGRHDMAELSVGDNGAPVDATVAARIFEPFAQPHDSVRDGSGLGVAIARHYIESMGGRIEFAPGSGQPCRFVITLPQAPAPTRQLPLTGVTVATLDDARNATLRNALASLGATLQQCGEVPRQTVVALPGTAEQLETLDRRVQLIEVCEPISPSELVSLLQEQPGCRERPVRTRARTPTDLPAAQRIDALLETANAVVAGFGHGAPVAQPQIFLAVAQDHFRGTDTLMSALPQRLGLHRRTVSRHLAALGHWGTHHKRGLGLIESAPSYDHRTKVLTLTRAGMQLAHQIVGHAAGT